MPSFFNTLRASFNGSFAVSPDSQVTTDPSAYDKYPSSPVTSETWMITAIPPSSSDSDFAKPKSTTSFDSTMANQPSLAGEIATFRLGSFSKSGPYEEGSPHPGSA